MKKALNLLFWGYLFIFLRLQFGIDLFPDPIGYFLIVLGSYNLEKTYPTAKKVRFLATAMIVISIPTMLVNTDEYISFGWNTYSNLLLFLQLIVVYFLFSILQSVAKDYGDDALQQRTNRTFTFYISLNLIILAFLSFSLNVSGTFFESIMIILILPAFIIEIMFLVLIREIRRSVPDDLDDTIHDTDQ